MQLPVNEDTSISVSFFLENAFSEWIQNYDTKKEACQLIHDRPPEKNQSGRKTALLNTAPDYS
jgi:hypothetical protein